MLAAADPGTRIAERFVLEALAGAGGMGTVYRALDEHTGHTVALKLLQSTGRPHESERFLREADLLAKLRHPGIVGYHAHGVTEAGEPYLAMEWLEGEDLSQRLARGALSLAESITLLRGTAEALAVAHELGIVHRDLKPGNLFLRHGLIERVALLDFGIARPVMTSQVMTRSGMWVGTPGYMAPDQARGEQEVTPAADVFSLGCVLFECLTGNPPFAADHVIAVLAKILFDEPPRLRRTRPEMPEAVEALLGRMLAKDKVERLPDAQALLDALRALEGLSLEAALGPEEAAPRSRHLCAEQRLISVLMAVLPAGTYAARSSPDATIGDEQLIELHLELSAQGARLEVLADGSLVATLAHRHGVATDQAAQAARCALSIKARWPGATIALCTGRGLLQERLPVGEVLDRAAALLRDRPPSPPPSEQILLDEVTQGLLEVRFQVHRTPSGGYALHGEALDLDASRPLLGKPTPCVGRDVELGLLENALASSIEEGAPRAVLVTAPPGVGKSRLRHELLRRVAARDEEVLILLGRGEPMSAGSSYSLLGQALRRLCGIQVGESLPARRQKLASRLGERLAAAEQARVVAFLGELCGAPFPDEGDIKLRAARQDPQLMSDQITQALLDFLRAECAARPVLLVLEDLHWGDTLTVKLCEAALRKLKGCPLMMLALARPEVHELFPRLWSGAAQVVPLRPLSKKAGERLVQQVLGKQVTRETVARIVEQSEGNALFLEELIRAAADGQGDEAPATVLAMLQARIDRLNVGTRWVLRGASVFGETCWLGGLRALFDTSEVGPVLEGLLSRLTEDELLEERPESRFPEEREYRFRHALMRDAAYGLMTEDDRARAHRVAGQYLEARGEPDARVLAEHFWQGREADRAISYYLQAAEESYEAFDMAATLASAERGLACGAQGERRGALLSLQVATYMGRGQYAEVLWLSTEALDLLPPGSKRWCRAIQYVFSGATVNQQTDVLVELSPRFARVDPSADAPGEYVRAAVSLATGFCVAGDKEASRVVLERARQVGAALEHSDVVAWAHLKAAEATAHHWIEEAPWSCLLKSAEGRAAFRSAGDQMDQVLVSAFHGLALLELGDPAGAEADLRETLAQAERVNESYPLSFVKSILARLLSFSASQDRLDESSRLARDVIEAKNIGLRGMAHGCLAEIKRRQGDLAGADEEARAACELVRPAPVLTWTLLAFRSRILLDLGRAEEALAIAEGGVRELERLGLAGYGELALRLSLAEALAAVGRAEAARAALENTVERLRVRLADIPEAAARERYLTQVPTHARLLALAREWLGLDVRA